MRVPCGIAVGGVYVLRKGLSCLLLHLLRQLLLYVLRHLLLLVGHCYHHVMWHLLTSGDCQQLRK